METNLLIALLVAGVIGLSFLTLIFNIAKIIMFGVVCCFFVVRFLIFSEIPSLLFAFVSAGAIIALLNRRKTIKTI